MTVARWLDGLPEAAIMADPPVAYVAAWIRGYSGASKQQTEDWLAAVERDGDEEARGGAGGSLPDGVSSLAFGANLARASLVFDDVGRSAAAGRRALELAGPEASPFWWMAQSALGHALYLSGRPAETRPQLEELVRRVPAAAQPVAVVLALAVLSLLAGDQDDDRTRHGARPSRGDDRRRPRAQRRADVRDRLCGAGAGAGPPGRAG